MNLELLHDELNSFLLCIRYTVGPKVITTSSPTIKINNEKVNIQLMEDRPLLIRLNARASYTIKITYAGVEEIQYPIGPNPNNEAVHLLYQLTLKRILPFPLAQAALIEDSKDGFDEHRNKFK